MSDAGEAWINKYLPPEGAPIGGPPAGEDWINKHLGPPPAGEASAGGQELRAAPPEATGISRYAGLARNAIVGGLFSALGAPGDVAAALRPSGRPAPDLWFGKALPTTQDFQTLYAPTGVLNTGGLTPQGWEKPAVAALSGAASIAPELALGGPALSLLAQGTAGGLAGEVAREYAPGVAGAPLVAGALAGGLVQGGMNLAAGDPFKVAAKALGSSRTPEEAGIELQEAVKNWRSRSNESGTNVMDQRIAEAAAPLDAGIPPETPTPAQDLIGRLRELTAQGGQAANAARGFLRDTQRSGGFLGRVAQKVNSVFSDPLAPADAVPQLTWEEQRALRSELGASLRTARPQERGALEYMYGGSTADLSRTAQEMDLGDEFAHFNKVSTDLHHLDAGPLEDIASAGQPADAAARLITQAKRGGQVLQQLRDAGLGDAVDELAASHLTYKPEDWKRLSPEGRAALVTDPTLRGRLDTASLQGHPSPMSRGIEHLSGMQLGDLIGMATGHFAGLPELQAGAIGGLLGYGLPYLPGAFRRLTRPDMLGAETVGAIGGTTQPQPQSQ